jgi:hypothetical protein
MANPFSLSFGTEPKEYITRNQQIDKIVSTFKEETPSNYAYMLTGIRGVGKTVMLSTITETFEKEENWIVINVSPDMDILTSIVAHLSSRKKLQNIFAGAKLDLSAFGIGVSVKDATPVYDITTALEKLLAELQKKNYRVLIAIDEIVNNPNVKVFAGVYQILLRKKFQVFLLMTGLYENINNLQNEKTLTFLYRAPKVYLEPLNKYSIARSYKKVFNLDENTAKEMANLTNGYAYAYQVLGYLYWEKSGEAHKSVNLDDLVDEYDSTLSEYVYEKIWFELPETEKRIASLLVRNGLMKIKDIREELGLTDSQMAVYRDRLKRRGIVDASKYGQLSLILPRFREIASIWMD